MYKRCTLLPSTIGRLTPLNNTTPLTIISHFWNALIISRIGVKNIEMKRYYLFGTKACEILMDSYERLYMDIKHGAIDRYHLMEFDPLTDNPTDLLYLVRYKWGDYAEITESQYNKLDRL